MKCKICGREFVKITSHIKRIHGINVNDYYDKFMKQDGEDECLTCGGLTTFEGITKGYRRFCSPGCVSRNKNIQYKKEKSYMDHYGVKNPRQSSEIQEKYKRTCLEKYGVDNPFASEKIKTKISKTIRRKYGVDHPYQNSNIKNKGRHTNIERYGVDHWGKTDEARLKSRHVFIKMVEDQRMNGEPLTPRIGESERSCLNELQKYIDFKIIRNPQIIGYFPDGYIEELNLVIEFDERHHFTDDYEMYCDRDVQKDKDYCKENLICFRIKKIDWEQTKNIVIDEFKSIMENCNVRKEK